MRGGHLPDKGNIRTIRFPRPIPKRMEAQGFVSKKPAWGKADREMIANGTQN